MVQFSYNYLEESTFKNLDEYNLLKFETDQSRSEKVRFKGKVIPILEYRDSMLCLRDIVVSNYAKKLKDRGEYYRWLNRELDKEVDKEVKRKIRKYNENLTNVQKEIDALESERWKINTNLNAFNHEIQGQFYEFKKFIRKKQIRELYFILDPVISVHPDTVIFEALSLDESSYGNLSIGLDQFEIEGNVSYGTTNIDFSQKLSDEFGKTRSIDNLYLEINPGGLTVESDKHPAYIEKKIDLPESWVKGFLQVSSAMAFPATEFSISTNDLYNIINFLKGHRAIQSPRALRFDLFPGRNIFVIVEPWNTVIRLQSVYTGKKSQTVRIWGRRRILLLERILPHIQEVKMRLVGKGMPFFIRCKLAHVTFTLGLSGWTQNNWSQGVAFSTILGSGMNYDKDIINYLQEFRNSDLKELEAKFQDKDPKILEETIAYLYRFGKAFFDLNYKRIRYRELSSTSFPNSITDLTKKEKEALKLTEQIESYTIQEDKLKNATITCEFSSSKQKSSLTLSEEGVFMNSQCYCSKSRTSKSNKTICPHILALISKFIISLGD